MQKWGSNMVPTSNKIVFVMLAILCHSAPNADVCKMGEQHSTSSPLRMFLTATETEACATLKWIEFGSQLWLTRARVGQNACPSPRTSPTNQDSKKGDSYWKRSWPLRHAELINTRRIEPIFEFLNVVKKLGSGIK